MAKVRIAALAKRATRTTKRHKRVVHTTHVRGPGGKQLKLFAVDSSDENFDDDLAHVFSLNITSAREANTALFGSPDGPGKSVGKAQKSAQKLK